MKEYIFSLTMDKSIEVDIEEFANLLIEDYFKNYNQHNWHSVDEFVDDITFVANMNLLKQLIPYDIDDWLNDMDDELMRDTIKCIEPYLEQYYYKYYANK